MLNCDKCSKRFKSKQELINHSTWVHPKTLSSQHAECSGYVVVVVTTAQLHSTKPEPRFCAGSNPVRGVSEIRDGDDLWKWPRLEIRLNAFLRSTIPQKQFIIFIIIITGPGPVRESSVESVVRFIENQLISNVGWKRMEAVKVVVRKRGAEKSRGYHFWFKMNIID